MKINKIFIIITIFLIGGFLYLYINNQNQPVQEPLNVKRNQELTTAKATAIKEINIIAKKWTFNPSEIRVKQGDKVRLKIKSVDVAHGFNLPVFNVDKYLEPGKEVVVEFFADKKGSFPFLCSVYCGAGHSGMRGSLVVE